MNLPAVNLMDLVVDSQSDMDLVDLVDINLTDVSLVDPAAMGLAESHCSGSGNLVSGPCGPRIFSN